MLQPYFFIFYRGNSLLGKIIRFISNGKYSHCAIMLDQFHTLETAWNKPSVITHFSYRYKDYDIYRLKVKLTECQKQIILQYITEHISVGYDYKYLITRFFHLLFGTKIINSKNRYDCDELICEAFKSVGINLIEDGELLTPSVLSESKYLKRINL